MIRSEDIVQTAEEILESLRAQLEHGHISRLIDEPIDAAAREFRCPDAPAKSQTELLDHAAAFLRHVHVTAFPTGRQLTPIAARGEVVRLLEFGYPNGFHGALLEATRPAGPGIPLVVAQLAALVSSRIRDSYIRSVIASHLGRADWPTKCRMASIILSEWGDWRPTELAAASAEQFASFLPQLLLYDQLLRNPLLAST